MFTVLFFILPIVAVLFLVVFVPYKWVKESARDARSISLRLQSKKEEKQ